MGMISESDKNEILTKYSGNTNDDVFNFLRRNYPKKTTKTENFTFNYIVIDGRMRHLGSKKEIVNRLFNEIESLEKFQNVDTSVIRRTIKMYLDFLMSK
jgi:hypothetical protein